MARHKITAPGLAAGIVRRERLFRLLDHTDKPVRWISGPGGSGKTTLVSSYLEARDIPAIWYQADQTDADPATFFYYMGLAFQDSVSPDCEPLPLLTPEYLAGLKTFARRYFRQLFTQLPAPFAIVIDNYQEIPATSPFHELIAEGLAEGPEGICVLAISREEPPAVLTADETAARFDFLGWNDLRFSFDEAKEFAATQSASPMESEALTRLYTKTDGWIAGLFLILESLNGGALDEKLLQDLPLDKVFGYFADKIFEARDGELQNFLLKTALVPGITAQMAERLTGIGSSEQILSRLCRNRFFTAKISPADPVYQYHPLFREFLVSRAEKTLPPSELREIRRQAASLLKGGDRAEDAAGLLIEASDWDGIAELILDSAPLLAAEGRSETVRCWLENLPAGCVERNPGLLYWKGVCLLLHSPPASRACFREAYDLYRLAGDRVGMLLSWSGGAEASLYDREFTPLDQWLALLEEMRIEEIEFPTRQLEEQIAMSIFNAMAFRQPHHRDISKWRERALSLVRGSADLNLRLQSAIHLVVHDLWNGNFGRATVLLEQTLAMASSGKPSPMTRITIMNAQVLYCYFTGAWASGVAIVSDALKMANESGVHVWDSQLMGTGAGCALCMGDSAAADELLNAMRDRLQWGMRLDIGQYHGLRGWQESLGRRFQAAIPHLEHSLESLQGTGFMATEVVMLITLADNLGMTGNATRARACLSRAYDIARGMGSGYLEFLCLLNSAALALDAADEVQGDMLLRQAMTLGSAGGYLNGWCWRPDALVQLCTKALENDIETAYVTRLVRHWALAPEKPPQHLDEWPWQFRIFTLGGFQLLRGNELLALTGKAKKPLELLKAVVAFGGSNVPLERLTDALWPDADGDLAQRSFDTTLHRLRKLLADEKVLQLQAGKLSINPRYCWIDTWAFERRCGEIDASLHAKEGEVDQAKLPLAFEKGAALYQGSFLPDDAALAWTVPMRDQMHNRLLRLISRAGGYFEALEQWDQAATWYGKGIRLDPVAEQLHQRLMVCYRQQGMMALAIKTYLNCRSILSTELGIAPSAHTEELYRSFTVMS
ncbi:Transcriptional activator of maltose regulon, MalT [Citrifermentans bremense]|uniref:Transcriptional activator of maltose regulon, MalT n=1 Tax=Citrifermentans bremense TaxID=60035 RepID=A0A6S6MAC3_9BACT|nr:BTAD domain-containing putative transcriptional regulator [Citrifermentans bremense]BCG48694.1 Transcriptional activator of maltose regulon, MalT [Citrifermentans bremense]